MKKEEISLKNTKAEILEALNEALEREKNINKVKSDPIKEEKEKKTKEAVETSKENVSKNIFSDELNNKFNSLEMAIAAEEEKLKDLYGIEKELANITLVVNAGKDVLREIEDKKALETDKLNESIKSLEEMYQKKKNELEQEYDLKAKTLKLERDREIEEYNYKLKRDREIDKNKWDDEKRVREDNLKNKELETKKIFEEAKEKESYLKDLESKVSSIPDMIQKEYERGVKETTANLKKEYDYQIELLKKDYQNTIDRQNDKIESLNNEVNKINELNNKLQDKLDKAYLEMKELATTTVEANGGVKIIGNNQGENK